MSYTTRRGALAAVCPPGHFRLIVDGVDNGCRVGLAPSSGDRYGTRTLILSRGLGAGVSTPAADDRSDQALADQVGITVPFLRAIRKVESSGHPSSIRFEPRVFRANTSATIGAQIPYTPNGRGSSNIASETNAAAFHRAYALDPAAAVKAVSWGAYQVLGGHLLNLFGGDPAAAVAGFNADPAGVSDRLLIDWMKSNTGATNAARALDFATFAHLYNGAPLPNATPYSTRLRAAYDSALTTWTGISPGIQWVPIAIGATAVAASAGFAFWAWRRSRHKK
jgi:hypothetical protein